MLEVNGTVVVRGKVARRAWRASPWLSADDVVSRDEDAGPFVDLVDESALPLGTGLLGSTPARAVRLVTSARTRDPVSLLKTRLERADARRRVDVLGADAYRLCHAEADGVVGIEVDRFGSGLAVRGDAPEVEPLIPPLIETLVHLTRASSIACWPTRAQGGTGEGPRLVLGDQRRVRFHHGRLLVTADLLADGIFDVSGELEAQRFVRRWARGRVLDAYAGSGGYALQMADAGTREVVVVERDEAKLATLEEDARRNGLGDRLRLVREDPREHLHALDEQGEVFDCVVVHPPRVVEPADAADDAAQRALDLHRRALRLLDEGGLLVTTPSSTALSSAAFDEALSEAAVKNRKRLQVLAELGAGLDHPALIGMPDRVSSRTLVARVVAMA